MASAVILGLIIVTVVLGPLFWRVPINDIDFAATQAGPSWQHPFGTDDLGQDLRRCQLQEYALEGVVGVIHQALRSGISSLSIRVI